MDIKDKVYASLLEADETRVWMKELIRKMNSHDWHYEFSDDHKVYQHGNEQRGRITFLTKQLINAGKKKEVDKIWKKNAPKEFQKIGLNVKADPLPAPQKFSFKSGAIKKKGKNEYLNLMKGKWVKTSGRLGVLFRNPTQRIQLYVVKYRLKPNEYEIVDADKIK